MEQRICRAVSKTYYCSIFVKYCGLRRKKIRVVIEIP